MSVENIKAFSIIGMEKSLDDVVMTLGKSKIFQPDEVANFYSNTKDFTHVSTANKYSDSISRMVNGMNALKIKPEYVNTKKFDPDFSQLEEYSIKFSNKASELILQKSKAKRELNECRRAIEEMSHFVSVDFNIDEILSMKYVKTVFGRIPKESIPKLENYSEELFEFIPCTEEDKYVWGLYFTPLSHFDRIEHIFSRLYFEASTFANINTTPAKKIEHLRSDVYAYEKALDDARTAVDDYIISNKNEILKYYTKISEYSLFGTIRAKAMIHNNNFCITGWVPEKQAKSLKKKLEKCESVEVSVTNGNDELQLSPPVKLKNCFLTRPFQYYTEMYGVPKYKEIDPTSFIAFTYVILFGIMFGDVGHGFCVAVAGLLMWIFKKMPIGKILIPCGISGMFFGALFGSVFGFEDAMDWFYVDILGMQSKPIEVMSSEMTNTIIYVAVGIGMLLLCLAMMLNIYSSARQGDKGKMLFDTSGLCGLIFYGMLCAGLIAMLIFGVNLFTVPYIIIIAVAFVLVFMREPLGDLVNGEKNWKPKSWGDFILQNAFESIEVLLSYVTNTLSFLRVGAFVLVHAGMMTVVFTLAETVGGAGYIPVVIFGNALVCVLEALLVAIQVLRLEYYEMFSRFYSGEGRPYTPVNLKQTHK